MSLFKKHCSSSYKIVLLCKKIVSEGKILIHTNKSITSINLKLNWINNPLWCKVAANDTFEKWLVLSNLLSLGDILLRSLFYSYEVSDVFSTWEKKATGFHTCVHTVWCLYIICITQVKPFVRCLPTCQRCWALHRVNFSSLCL